MVLEGNANTACILKDLIAYFKINAYKCKIFN